MISLCAGRRLRWAGLLAALALSACAGRPAADTSKSEQQAPAPTLISENYAAADKLLDQVGDNTAKVEPIVVTSLADIGNLDRTSPFGKYCSELIASRLAQRGVAVSDVRLRTKLAIAPEVGESGISEDVAHLRSGGMAAQSLLIGTYADNGQDVMISIKLIRIDHAVVVAAYDYTIEVDRDEYRKLLAPPMKKPAAAAAGGNTSDTGS